MKKNKFTIIFKYFLGALISIIIAMFIYTYYIQLMKDWGEESFKFSLWCWFASLGWLVITLNILNIKGLKFENYYAIKNIDFERKIYLKFKVNFFKKFMFNGDYFNRIIRIFNPKHNLISGYESMIEWEKKTKTKEFAHLIHFCMAAAAFVYAIAIRNFTPAVYIIVFNVMFNVYPIMLQRYTRIRIHKVISRYKRKR